MKRRKVRSQLFLAVRYMADISGFHHMKTFKNVKEITKAEFYTFRNPVRIKNEKSKSSTS